MIHQVEELADQRFQTPATRSMAEEGQCSQFYDYVKNNPSQAVIFGLGVGLGAGLLLSSLLRGSSSYFSKDEAFVERMTHKMKDALSEVMPSSLKSRFRT